MNTLHIRMSNGHVNNMWNLCFAAKVDEKEKIWRVCKWMHKKKPITINLSKNKNNKITCLLEQKHGTTTCKMHTSSFLSCSCSSSPILKNYDLLTHTAVTALLTSDHQIWVSVAWHQSPWASE